MNSSCRKKNNQSCTCCQKYRYQPSQLITEDSAGLEKHFFASTASLSVIVVLLLFNKMLL